MEFIVASSVGVLTAGGIYLILRLRVFAVVLGLALLSYAVNVFLFATGRITIGAAPVLDNYAANPTYADPLPQALVLTAIVISFGMTAVLVMFALGAYLESGDDHLDMKEVEPDVDGHDVRGIAWDEGDDESDVK